MPPSAADELPRVTVELEALEILVEAYLDTISEKQKRKFLGAVFDRQTEAGAANIIPLHDRAMAEMRERKRRGALAWTRARLPAWMVGA